MDRSAQSQPSDPGATPSYKGITLAGSGSDCPETIGIIPNRNEIEITGHTVFISTASTSTTDIQFLGIQRSVFIHVEFDKYRDRAIDLLR